MYVIDGVFLTRRLTGIERYALNMVRELDKIVSPGEFVLLVPLSYEKEIELKNIKLIRYGHIKGYLWEQTDLPSFIRKHKAVGIFLTNAVPLFSPRGIVVLHDISLKVNPELFSGSVRNIISMLFWRFIYRVIMCSKMRIITVSEFSQSEILRVYRIDRSRTSVIGSAWQHMDEIDPDTGILDKLGLKKGGYYFGMATAAPNKNMKWIVNAAYQHPGITFVIGGHRSENILNAGIPSNLILTGYLSDGEAKALMGNCRAFLFPTFYEGFGLPPMEALSSGADAVIVSDTPCMHEIYGDIASFIDPYDYDHTKLDIKSCAEQEKNVFLSCYSWKASAEKLYKILNC